MSFAPAAHAAAPTSPTSTNATRNPASGLRVSGPVTGVGMTSAISNAQIVNYASGRCLDHSDWGRGLYAYVYPCNGAANQRWYSSGSTIRDYASGQCLDHSNWGTGLYAYVYPCNGANNQLWYFA
jgi:alpha-galactosidase